MDLIMKRRGHGKTYDLIQMSALNKIPIVCYRPEFVKKQAKEMKIDIPEPISYEQCVIGRGLAFGDEFRHFNEVYIDELEWFLRAAFGLKCQAATIDIGRDDVI